MTDISFGIARYSLNYCRMNEKFIAHPKLVDISGFKFQVLARMNLTDQQALNIALHYFKSHRNKLSKAHRNKILEVVSTFDERLSDLL